MRAATRVSLAATALVGLDAHAQLTETDPIARISKGKAKQSDSMDDWIVDDDDISEGDCSSEGGDSDSEQAQRVSYRDLLSLPDRELQKRASKTVRRLFGKSLSGIIVLSGPSGAGKTASVYAAAKTLGWDVFEVFPGIGARSARDLERYVGDATRNHQVQMQSACAKSATQSFFDSSQRQKEPHQVCDCPKCSGVSTVKRESLILIDEVDVRYCDDKDFWHGASVVRGSWKVIAHACLQASKIWQHIRSALLS